MAKKKLSIEDIFNDDEFGLLESRSQINPIKTAEDRLIDSFEELNVFIDKNGREPNQSSMSEYSLMARLKNFRQNDSQKLILKPFDRHNLLGELEVESPTIDDILEDDDFNLLDEDDDLEIFKYKHIKSPSERAETDFVAHRKPMKEKDFEKYEKMFFQVHKDIKEGKREIKPFKDVEKHLKEGHFYISEGVMLYLEKVDLIRSQDNLKETTLSRKDGRTRIIFENGTISNMLYRSLSKNLYSNNGKIITNTYDELNQELFVNAGLVREEDIESGWIYVLKSKSKNKAISAISNLFKVGFSSTPVEQRIKNAKNEATYLFDDVKIVATYRVYNINATKLENLIHRFFGNACLNVDLTNEKGQRISPREWFAVPFEAIETAIKLIINGNIIHYYYDVESEQVKLKMDE